MLIPWKERLEEQLLVVPRCKCRVLRNHIPPNPNPTNSHLAPEGRYFCLGIHCCPPSGRSKRAAGCARLFLASLPLPIHTSVLTQHSKRVPGLRAHSTS